MYIIENRNVLHADVSLRCIIYQRHVIKQNGKPIYPSKYRAATIFVVELLLTSGLI